MRRYGWSLAVTAVALLGAVLRLLALHRVPDNPFYDAAVRSMTHSLHNFFYGAFEPGASASIDKPPFDLWLQVITVKLLGFSSTTLKLPSAIAGTLAVPLLYDLLRRLANRPAALAGAATLAILPVSVVTARSDTMDSLMMALLIGVAWLLLRYLERRELRWLVLGALLLGLDFNVKLFEALVPLPALLIALWLGWRGEPFGLRLRGLAVALAAFAAIALSWLAVVSLTPARDRPYPIGSTNGSVWNAVFVFNGSDRILKAPHPSRFDAAPLNADAHPALLTAAVRRRHKARPPSAPAGALRLFRRSLVDFGGLVGTLLFASLLFGAAALARVRPRSPLELAASVGAGVWLLTGFVLFSFAGRVHPRYLEAFTPAIAGVLGVSIWVLARERRGASLLAAALGLSVLEAAFVTGNGTLVRGGLAVGVVLAIATAAAIGLAGRRSAERAWPAAMLVLGTTAALLAFPLARDIRLIRDHSGVQAASPRVSPKLVVALSRYLRAHQGGARYEFAASAPSLAAPLVVRDVRPIRLLTTVDGRPLETLGMLQSDATAGNVRYVVTRGRCPHPPYRLLPACAAAVKWVVAHAQDVTSELGVPGSTSGLLYRLRTGSLAH